MNLTPSEIKAVLPMLENVPLFATLNDKQLKSVGGASSKRTFSSGEMIARQGESGICFYLILDGRVEVRRGSRMLSKLGRGQFFGEMALFDKEPRSADVVAVEDTTCLILTSWNFKSFVKVNPEVSFNLIKELVRRLRETDRSLSE
jgi:CRP/FNR family cyclic AMP-dependent transcriptional regulator